jgi:hypothetical protein
MTATSFTLAGWRTVVPMRRARTRSAPREAGIDDETCLDSYDAVDRVDLSADRIGCEFGAVPRVREVQLVVGRGFGAGEVEVGANGGDEHRDP